MKRSVWARSSNAQRTSVGLGWIGWLGLAVVGLSACKRPVEGRDVGASRVSDLQVVPSAIRADVSIDISFRVSGLPPSEVSYELAGTSFDCEPERQGDDRYHCANPGIDRQNFAEGNAVVVLEAKDQSNKTSVATARVTIDFSCPRFVSLMVNPPIAEVGNLAVINIEASEPLADPPEVTRAGRPWEIAVGSGSSYSVTHEVTLSDPAAFQNLTVKLEDLAGNRSGDCNLDGSLPFAVDHSVPGLDPQKITLVRDAPGQPSIISGELGAVLDDVGVQELRVFDETGDLQLASLQIAEDGSLPAASLGIQPQTRVLLQAVDLFGRESPKLSVAERWRLSIGQGGTPGAAIGSAVRFSSAPPGSKYLRDKTLEFAPDVLQADARTAVVRARVGFEESGNLPNSYENRFYIAGGYDTANGAIVAFGGIRDIPDGNGGFVQDYGDRTLILKWDDREGRYIFELGQPYIRDLTPTGRGGHKIAFDGNGCGIMFGGDGLKELDDEFFDFQIQKLNDVWRICGTPQGHTWTEIFPVNTVDNGFPLIRRTPIAYDPDFNRYAVIGGRLNGSSLFAAEDVLFLQPGDSLDDWMWVDLNPLPSTFGERHSHLVYYDPEQRALATGLGYTQDFQLREDWWVYRNGQWNQYTIPNDLEGRQGFGYDYDTARRQLVFWGDNDPPFLDEDVWYLTGSSTSAASGWRRTNLDPPVPRAWPTVIYDADREVTVAMGGVRFDERFVPPTIYSIISEPSWPYLNATIDLAAARPKGITTLHLDVRVLGFGDEDGLGPSINPAGGVVVKLWDHNTSAWVDVAEETNTTGETSALISIDLIDQPERFVSPQGTVPISIVTLHPATEAQEAELQVDLIDGYLQLRSGVTLP